jgi:lysozyme
MKPSQQLVDFIASHEGLRLSAYRPLPTDRWTIGYGSTFIEGKPVVASQTITREQAIKALTVTLNEFAVTISKPGLPPGITQEQFDAVLSLVYNIGFSAFRKSDTGKRFYAGHDISDRFALYNKSGGSVVPGLVTRRENEKNIYTKGVYV